MKVEPLEHYRVEEPEWANVLGQGPPPEGVTVYRGGNLIAEIKFGSTVEGSTQTTNLKDYNPGKVKINDILQDFADAGMLTHLPKQTE